MKIDPGCDHVNLSPSVLTRSRKLINNKNYCHFEQDIFIPGMAPEDL